METNINETAHLMTVEVGVFQHHMKINSKEAINTETLRLAL